MHHFITIAMLSPKFPEYLGFGVVVFFEALIFAFAGVLRDRILRAGIWRRLGPEAEARAGQRFVFFLRIILLIGVCLMGVLFYVLFEVPSMQSHSRY